MSNSTNRGPLGLLEDFFSNIFPARTPGTLGKFDQADPTSTSKLGDTPGPLGSNDYADPFPSEGLKSATSSLNIVLPDHLNDKDPDLILIASTVYGEANPQKIVYEEMAAIASVIVRQKQARNVTYSIFLSSHNSFAYGFNSIRGKLFRSATVAQRKKSPGMTAALKAARNALDNGKDYSNGAYFWAGEDLKSNPHYYMVVRGVKFTKPEYNLFGMKDTGSKHTEYYIKAGKDETGTRGGERGSYTYVYETTAAYGKTTFFKFGADFLKATGNKVYE
jgi:hypothetical protein